MKQHVDMNLKTAPGPFRAVWRGEKTAEFRKNDRGFQVNDVIRLMEWDAGAGCWIQPYRQVVIRVTHIARGWGMPDGYVMLSFKVLLRKSGWTKKHEKHETCPGC